MRQEATRGTGRAAYVGWLVGLWRRSAFGAQADASTAARTACRTGARHECVEWHAPRRLGGSAA